MSKIYSEFVSISLFSVRARIIRNWTEENVEEIFFLSYVITSERV